MTAFPWICVFLVTLVVLVKASDYFTESAERIGIMARVPSFVVGITILGVGTSLPELAASCFAVAQGASEVAIGNVCGSNITNIFLILGVVAIATRKIETDYDLLSVDLPVLVSSALYIAVTCYDGAFNVLEGLIGLCGCAIYLAFAGVSSLGTRAVGLEEVREEKVTAGRVLVQVFIVVLSGAMVCLSAKYLVQAVVKLSAAFGVPSEVIALTAVALGTSLPELAVSVVAIRKKKTALAIGNVLGSNIFNAFAVMGFSSLLGTVIVPAGVITFSIPFMVGGTLLYFFITQDKQLTIWEGLILVLGYVVYIGKVFALF